MNWFSQFFSIRGKASALLKLGIAKSKVANRDGAIGNYTRVIDMENVPKDLQASALFNRGLAYSQEHKPDLAMKDFKSVLEMEEVPARIASAARERLERMKRRSDRSGPDT